MKIKLSGKQETHEKHETQNPINTVFKKAHNTYEIVISLNYPI